MQAIGRQANQHIAFAHSLTRQHGFAFHCTHNEPCQIVLTVLIQTGHFSSFATNEGAAVGLATAGNAFHNGPCNIGIQFPDGKIIKEK